MRYFINDVSPFYLYKFNYFARRIKTVGLRTMCAVHIHRKRVLDVYNQQF